MSELMAQLIGQQPHPIIYARPVTFITPEDGNGESYCPRCNQDLPPEKFYTTMRGTRSSFCRDCACKKSARQREVYAKGK